jgi:hypothetical protein
MLRHLAERVEDRSPREDVTDVVQGVHGYLVAASKADGRARAEGGPWTQISWLLFLEPIGENRCRFVSRYRADCSDDLGTKLAFGPTLLEPVGFAMDRRMLLGVKERAEQLAVALREVEPS